MLPLVKLCWKVLVYPQGKIYLMKRNNKSNKSTGNNINWTTTHIRFEPCKEEEQSLLDDWRGGSSDQCQTRLCSMSKWEATKKIAMRNTILGEKQLKVPRLQKHCQYLLLSYSSTAPADSWPPVPLPRMMERCITEQAQISHRLPMKSLMKCVSLYRSKGSPSSDS